MAMKIAVCDDCLEDVLSLQAALGSHEVEVYLNADKLLADIEIKDIKYDLYFLDIFIDDSIDGIELAKRIRAKEEEAAICFISTSNEFYREAFDLYAIQYLLKPVQKESVQRLLDRVSKNLTKTKEKFLSFKHRGQTSAIPYSKIMYICSREHTISIYCTDGTVQEYIGKLNELAGQICGDVFIRSHQSFLVNMYKVDSLNRNELMVGGERIPISRRYYAEVKKRYQEILFEEVD